MFFEVYLETFLSTTNPTFIINSTFREEFYDIFINCTSQDIPPWVNRFQSEWNQTISYLHALRVLDCVLGAVLNQQSQSKQCQPLLMEMMTQCARCAGFSHTCLGLSKNVMCVNSDLVKQLWDMKDKADYIQLYLTRFRVVTVTLFAEFRDLQGILRQV